MTCPSFDAFNVAVDASQTVNWAITNSFLRDYKLLKYAYLNWNCHAEFRPEFRWERDRNSSCAWSAYGAKNRIRETTLHFAVRHFVKGRHQSRSLSSKSDVVQVLWNRGASVKLCSDEGKAPFHDASVRRSVPLVRLLRSHEPGLSLDFSDGTAMLNYYVAGTDIKSLGCLLSLLRHGANEGKPQLSSLLSCALQKLLASAASKRPLKATILSNVFLRQTTSRFTARRSSISMTDLINIESID